MGELVLRDAMTDDDLEAWRRVRLAVLPGERAPTVAEMRASATPETHYVLAELDGRLAGSGVAERSSFDYAGLHPRVLPEVRRRGVGSALLAALAERAVATGFVEAGGQVDDPGSLAFAERFGFREVDRQVEQVRTIGEEPRPTVPDGIEVMTVEQRPETWAAAYEGLALPAFADMVTARPIVVSREQWERDWLVTPEAMYVALVDGEVVGCAGLELDVDRPDRAEHALTAVARDWRRRGIGALLKRQAFAYAAEHGIREVYTWTQAGNDDMQALNARLGFRPGGLSVTVRRALPLD